MTFEDGAIFAHTSSKIRAKTARAFFARPSHPSGMDTEWFRNRMAEVGARQHELAAKLGRDRTSAGKLLLGRVQIKVNQVRALAEILQVEPVEVLRRAGLDLDETDGLAESPQPPIAGTPPDTRPILGIDRVTLRYAFEKVLLNFVDEAEGTLEPVDIDGLFDRVWKAYQAVDEKGQKISG